MRWSPVTWPHFPLTWNRDMGTAAGMISQARALLGTTEQPPGSNHNLVTVWYGFDGPWCDMSISYEAGHSDNLPAVFGKFAYTVAHATAFQSHGRWHYDSAVHGRVTWSSSTGREQGRSRTSTMSG